jgi:hypothetical protein
VLAVLCPVNRRLIALEEPEDLAALEDDRDVAVKQFLGRPRAWRLLPAPRDEGIEAAEVVLGEAADDVFLGLEVVVERGLCDVPYRFKLAGRQVSSIELERRARGRGRVRKSSEEKK